MTNIEKINKDIETLILQVEGEEALEEVKQRYKPFAKNLDELLGTDTIDNYFDVFNNIDEEENLVCFNLEKIDDIKIYVEENKISFEELKQETMIATCEVLKFIIYDSEDEEY